MMKEQDQLQPDKTKSLRAVIEETDLDYRDLFTDDFVREHTNFSNIDDFFEAAGWKNSHGELDHQVTVGEADKFTKDESDYSTWHQFMDHALENYWDSPHQNRRRHSRHSCEMDVLVEAGMDEFRGTIVDISKQGFRLKIDEKISNTRTIKVQLPRQESNFDSDLVLRGTIRWKSNGEGPCALGVEILSKRKL
jgi:hypothetical protein